MPEEGFHYEGETGTKIRIETEKDLTAALTLTIDIKDPAGNVSALTATAVAGDDVLSIAEAVLPTLIAGVYVAHANPSFTTPWDGLGRAVTFEVFSKFATPD